MKFADDNSGRTATTPPADNADWGRRFTIAAALMLGLRIIVLLFAHHELGPDETQYWFWSETPAFGYFSKPPLIAWTIAATTGLFGDAEWAVRLAAPLLHIGTAGLLFLLARRLYDAQTGFWTGLTWLLTPGVIVSSAIISTDALLLFFWSAGLYALLRLATRARAASGGDFPITDCLLLGGAIGFGFLAKYAMVYFLIGVAVLPIIERSFRNTAFIIPAAIAGLIGVIIFSPNILWNMDHEFQTLAHTAANANWRNDLFHPIELLEFLSAQFGLVGPIILVLAIAAAVISIRTRVASEAWKGDWKSAFLLAFTLPPIAIVSVQAFISRAHANWAAAAYPAAIVFAVAYGLAIMRAQKPAFLRHALPVSAALHAGVFLIFSTLLLAPQFADAIGVGGAFKRLRGWETQGADIAARAESFDAILCDDREVMGGLLYYANTDKPILAWESNGSIDHHYEAFHRLDGQDYGAFLLVSTYENGAPFINRFTDFEPLEESVVSVGAGRTRTLYLFRAGALKK